MKLTYWVAECEHDAGTYNIRGRTRKEAVRIRESYLAQNIPGRPSYLTSRYGPVHKVTVQYRDGFDLMYQAMEEGGIYEGPRQRNNQQE